MTIYSTFSPPTSDSFNITSNEIHVWCADLNPSEDKVQLLRRHLSESELERTNRFHFDQHRNQFIVCRGILRLILGRYLEVKPSHIQFVYGAYGKPALAKIHRSKFHFNLSHSGSLTLYAFTLDRELGVDVELVRPIIEPLQLAERFFSHSEQIAVRRVPRDQRLEAFFNCWTRKEAYVKAVGGGLSIPLNEFDVSLIPGEPARLIRLNSSSERASRWSLYALRPNIDYVGALAIEDHEKLLSCRAWIY